MVCCVISCPFVPACPLRPEHNVGVIGCSEDDGEEDEQRPLRRHESTPAPEGTIDNHQINGSAQGATGNHHQDTILV